MIINNTKIVVFSDRRFFITTTLAKSSLSNQIYFFQITYVPIPASNQCLRRHHHRHPSQARLLS